MGGDNVIYVAYCDVTDEFYVGRTCHPVSRFKQHLLDKMSAVYKRAEQYGKEHIYFFIVKAWLSNDEAAKYEAKYIYELYPKVNLINRSLPPGSYLAPFCNGKEKTAYYKALAYRIQSDMENGIGCFASAARSKVRADGKYVRCGTEPYENLVLVLGGAENNE